MTANCDTSSSSEPSDSQKKARIKKDKAPVLPPVPHEVMRTVSERHSKGLMSPYIYQILSQVRIFQLELAIWVCNRRVNGVDFFRVKSNCQFCWKMV